MSVELVEFPEIQEKKNSCIAHQDDQNVFAVMSDEEYRKLPIASWERPTCTEGEPCKECRREHRRKMVKTFHETIVGIHRVQSNINDLLSAALNSNIRWWDKQNENRDALFAQLNAEVRSSTVEIPDVLCAEVMAHPNDVILATLRDTARQAVERIFQNLKTRLDILEDKQVFGRIRWLGEESCKYSYFRHWRKEVVTSTDLKTASKTLSETEVALGKNVVELVTTYAVNNLALSDIVARYEHHVFNATRYQFPAPSIKKPIMVDWLIKSVPKCFHHHLFVVEGDMVRENVEHQQYLISKRTEHAGIVSQKVQMGFQYCPAVTLGSYVLTGWSGADL